MGGQEAQMGWDCVVNKVDLYFFFVFFFFSDGKKVIGFSSLCVSLFFYLKRSSSTLSLFFLGGDIVHSAVHAQGVPNIYVLPVGYFEEGGGECCDAEGFSFSGFSC